MTTVNCGATIGNPNHSNAYYNRAVSYQKMGQTDKVL